MSSLNWPNESQSALASLYTRAASTVSCVVKKNSGERRSRSCVFNDRRLVAAYEELRSQAVEQASGGPGSQS